jgi:peptidoglycan/xylan/chitin deacetylase (PgdA/CDA1 family)
MPQSTSLKTLAVAAFHRGGGLHLVRWWHRKGLRILMYHRFSDASALAAQCAHIRRHYHPVPMSQVAFWLKTGEPLRANALAVTIDDGYRDFLTVAHPVFREYGIPVTVFVVTDFLDGKLWLWTDHVQYAHRLAGRPAEEGRDMIERLKRVSNPERLSTLARLPETLGITLPPEPPAEYSPLSWEEVRRLASQGVEFGAHTRAHPILSSVASLPELTGEIAGSKQRLEEMLDRPVLHFCYPNGRWEDIGENAVAAVRAAGFETAVTTIGGLNHRPADPFLLRRIGAAPDFPPRYFHQVAAAFRV